jgi:hypothetical protein
MLTTPSVNFNLIEMKDFAASICHITYKEVAIVWGISDSSAVQRLNTIRKSLGKKKFHRLSVIQFCTAEDISPDEFKAAINNYYNSLGKNKAA